MEKRLPNVYESGRRAGCFFIWSYMERACGAHFRRTSRGMTTLRRFVSKGISAASTAESSFAKEWWSNRHESWRLARKVQYMGRLLGWMPIRWSSMTASMAARSSQDSAHGPRHDWQE